MMAIPCGEVEHAISFGCDSPHQTDFGLLICLQLRQVKDVFKVPKIAQYHGIEQPWIH
jgi:hypothetical protein